MKRLAIPAALVAAALLTGCGVTAEPRAMVTVEATPAATPLPEDSEDPAYNCRVDGNKVCGPMPGDEVEAWTRFDPAAFPTMDQPFKVEYMGTAMPGIDFPPSEYLTYPATAPNTVHVFHIAVGATQ